MRQKIHTLVALSAALLLATSCNDSFMDRQPHTEIGVESYFNTERDLQMYCYGLMNTPGYSYNSDQGTDDQATTDMVLIKNIMASPNPTSVTIDAGWDWERLYDINFFLANCERANVTPEVLAHYQGVARYYRAAFYMDKVKTYSDVPWYDKVLTTDDPDLYKARDKREVWWCSTSSRTTSLPPRMCRPASPRVPSTSGSCWPRWPATPSMKALTASIIPN